MEQINECFKCIELKKSLQVEKKKVSQKNRLITLLRELVRSYEAKDLNLTFTDLSQIYESSSSEVTILKQRLNLYLNENQELLQQKNEISSRNEILEKKYRDVEDEISHLRFVNKQLGDYYREKEADQDQNKDRLKKLARKLMCYEPKNSEVRKILNLQNTSIDIEPKPSKNSNRKKNEENVKDMKKDNNGDDDLITMKSNPSDILDSEEHDLSGSSECENDIDCNDTNNFLNSEEGRNSPSPVPVLDADKVTTISDDLIASQSFCDKSNSEKSCEIISNSEDGIINCEESDSSSICVDRIDHCSFIKNIPKETSSSKVHENVTAEVLPSLFEEDSCTYEDISEQNDNGANYKDSDDFLEFEDSIPNLISPLKSDDSRVLSYLDCNQTMQHDSVIQENPENSDEVDCNQAVKGNGGSDKNEKESSDIKNECSSNNGDQLDKKKKSSHSTFQSKYQTLNDSLPFSDKPINDSHVPLNGNYAPNYQFQSSHCFGCYNTSFDARPPITLKLYNCSNVEISIPPLMQKENLPIITVRDKCDLDKCCVNTSTDVNPTAVHCSLTPDKRNSHYNEGFTNRRIPTVSTCRKPWLNKSNCNVTENIKEPSNPYFQDGFDRSKNPDYYFLDYLSKNKVSESNSTFRKQCFGDSETENDTIKSNRLFPIKASKRFDLEHFCYRFGSLSLKYSFPEEACKVSTSDKMNSTSIYSSLFNISQPPVFHNSLKNSSTSNNKNEWIFGQNFLNGATKQDLSCKTATKRNNFLSQSTLENSTNKIKCCNIVQKSIWDLKSDGININSINGTINNKISANESVSNPFHKIYQFKGTKDCFQQATFDVNSKKTFSEKETNFESRQRIPSQSCMKSNLENNKVSTKETNDNPFRSNSVMLQTSQCSVINPCASTRTSKNDNVFSSDNKGSSKSIFDFEQGKDVLADNCLSHPTICNKKTEHNTTSQSLSQEKVIMDPVQPPALTNSHCSREKVTAEVSSKSHIKERLKDNLLRERPVLQKDKSPKKIKPSGLPQIKNISVNHQDLFKKPDSVNIKANADVKSTENKVEYKSFNTKEAKSALNEKSKIDSPKKADHFSKLNNKKSSPDVKRLCSNKVFPSQNGINEEPRLTAGSKLSNKRVVAHKKSVNISHNLVTDEEDTEIDDELQKIFKEMELLNIPLLSPLSKSPELFAEETSVMNETTKIKGYSENSDLKRNDKTIKSKEESKLNYSMEVEDENINSIEKLVNKEKLSKCDVINSRLKHNETINDPKQSLSSVDESEYNIFSDNHEIESLSDETSILSENQVNGDILDDTTMEISKETADNGVLESAKISNLSKTEEIDIHNLEKEKSTDNLNESKNYAPPNSEKKHTMSEECISTPDNNCPNKDVGTPECDKEVKLPSCSAVDNKPSIGLGFYVNRNDEESTSNVTVPLRPETPKLECSTITNDPNSDVFNVATEDISSSNGCNAENNSQLITEEVPEENEIPHEKEESSGIKRKLPENNEPFEGMCSKKQKMFSDDEYISCESDVFICALRYLSAAAVASLNGKVCSSPKTNSDVNLPTKIAINHIKNLIIEALQSIDGDTYEVLNCMVKKIKQINDASPTSLAKAIIEIIVESNDKSEAKDKPYMPSMTKTVKMCLLIAVSYIGYNRDFVMNFCEVFEQYISSFYDKSLKVAEGSQLVIFYTSFCRSYNLDDKVKYLIYDVLYTRNIKAYPMVYKTIQTWPDILPYSETCFAKDCVLTQTIIFILLSGASSVDDKSGNIYCINNIRSYLFKYFGYKCNFIRRDELTDKIIGNITAKGGSVALVLLCKCEPWEWSLSIVEKKLLPILQSTSSRSVDETIVCEYILTVGRVVRGFPITKAGHIVKNTLELFERMLLESHSTHLSEIIIEAISLLRRHNLMKCTSILMNWKPNNKQITKKTINHISSILRVKNIGYWKNVYSAHSSNIIHDTRTIRKKRKSGFLNPP